MNLECLSLIYWQAKFGSSKSGLSELSCSNSHMEQCSFDRLQSTLMANWAAFLWSINFFIALVTGPVIAGSLLKFKSSFGETVSLVASGVGKKNFLRCMMLMTLDLPLESKIHALVSLTSVILAGPCHLGIGFGFLPIGAKSFYHTKSSMWYEWGVALLSKLSFILAPCSSEMFLAKKKIFCSS
jgi:hypothetical protein